MRVPKLLAVVAVVMVIGVACKSDEGGEGQLENTGKVNVLNAMEAQEATAVQGLIDDQLADADYKVEIEASPDFEEQFKIRSEGGTLDVALLPQPGTVASEAKAGHLTSLEDLGMDMAALEDTFGSYLLSLGEYNGEHYGLPTNVNLKSMIWYPKDDFDAAGYQVPTTWDELVALSDQMVADGNTPWCVGFESGGATGWPATDWMEDIMLRTAGVETYDKWVKHEIPFNDPAVVHAGELFGDIMFGDGYVLGGAADTPSISFGAAPLPMFDSPPGCWLHRQANFIIAAAPFPEGSVAGTDYDWFPFPDIDQAGALFAGELAVVGSGGNRPEVKEFLDAFAGTDIQCAMGGLDASSRISPNVNVKGDCYVNPILGASADVLTVAIASGTGRFDASDLMPGEVGAGSFWTGMVRYMQEGPDSLQGVLDEIEASWPAS